VTLLALVKWWTNETSFAFPAAARARTKISNRARMTDEPDAKAIKAMLKSTYLTNADTTAELTKRLKVRFLSVSAQNLRRVLTCRCATQTLSKYLAGRDQDEGDKNKLNEAAAALGTLVDSSEPEVKLLVACCLADIIRIYAPEAPYSQAQLKVASGVCVCTCQPNDLARGFDCATHTRVLTRCRR
jgi:hypothetical protein